MERANTREGSVGEVFGAFLLLGLTSFGGPIAHLGYFREAFVVRRRWIPDAAYADLVALCQFLPGPASSQVGMAIGLRRAGFGGMLAAWTAFTLPSAVLLVLFAFGASAFGMEGGGGWIRGLKAAAVGVVGHAVLGMARTLAADRKRATAAVLGMALALLIPSALGQILGILIGALLGLAWIEVDRGLVEIDDTRKSRVSRPAAAACLALFFALLVLLPMAAGATASGWLETVDGFYRAGALVFGGGHVVLPLLQAGFVETGRVDPQAFLAGYGAAQAVPGPLFTFAAFLGFVAKAPPNGLAGAILALLSIFLPSALLVVGGLRFWETLRRSFSARRAVAGINAAVVGLLAAALYDPVFTDGVPSSTAMVVAAAAFVALTAWKAPAWMVVIAAGVAGQAAL